MYEDKTAITATLRALDDSSNNAAQGGSFVSGQRAVGCVWYAAGCWRIDAGHSASPRVKIARRHPASQPPYHQHLLTITHQPEILRHWVPDLEVHDIEVTAPHQHVHQIVGHEFGRSFFVNSTRNVARIVDLILVELACTKGNVLAVAQQAVESLIRDEMHRRFDLAWPERLTLAHYGNLTGLDVHRDVTTLLALGRPGMARRDAEAMAELIGGKPVEIVVDEDEVRFPTFIAGIRRADGTGTPVRQPTHPDPLVEAVRRSGTENPIMQTIARGRGVQRTADNPLRVVLVAEVALPLTVETVTEWEDAIPDRLTVAVAEAALTGRALPLHPADLAARPLDPADDDARPRVWRTAEAATKGIARSKYGQSLWRDSLKVLSRFHGLAPARYRVAGSYWRAAFVPLVAAREALQAELRAPLTAFELLEPARPVHQADPAPGVADVAPPARPPRRAAGPAPEWPSDAVEPVRADLVVEIGRAGPW